MQSDSWYFLRQVIFKLNLLYRVLRSLLEEMWLIAMNRFSKQHRTIESVGEPVLGLDVAITNASVALVFLLLLQVLYWVN
jgi:hypothetical protein